MAIEQLMRRSALGFLTELSWLTANQVDLNSSWLTGYPHNVLSSCTNITG